MSQFKPSTGWMVFALAVALLNLLLVRSAVAGVNQWTSGGPPNSAGYITCLVEAPIDPPIIYAGTAGGVFQSADHGAHWVAKNLGLPSGAILSIAVHPNMPTHMLLGTHENGVFRTTDGGDHWQAARAGIDNLAISALAMSSSGGAEVTAYAVSNRVVGGSLFISQDFGNSWSATTLDPQNDSITAVAAVPHDPSRVLVGTGFCYTTLPCFGHLQRSADSGLTWTTPVDFGPINDFVFDPTSPSIIYATSGSCGFGCFGGLARSSDGGATWTAVPLSPSPYTGLIIKALVVDPTDHSNFYLAVAPYVNQGGIYMSTDAGATVFPFPEGLPNVSPEILLTSIAIEPDGRTLHAGTDRASVFDFQIVPASSCTPDVNTLCLNGGRFMVQAQWTDFQGNSGPASVVPGATSNDSGVMWFFSPDNWELLIKVLNGCGINGHYWVFGAAATDVAYTIQVTDTQTGEVRTYTNPLGTTSPAITDAAAFPGCL